MHFVDYYRLVMCILGAAMLGIVTILMYYCYQHRYKSLLFVCSSYFFLILATISFLNTPLYENGRLADWFAGVAYIIGVIALWQVRLFIKRFKE